jgi:hypothetical protein
MIYRGTGSAVGKREALRDAGAHVVEHFGEIGRVARRILEENGG